MHPEVLVLGGHTPTPVTQRIPGDVLSVVMKYNHSQCPVQRHVHLLIRRCAHVNMHFRYAGHTFQSKQERILEFEVTVQTVSRTCKLCERYRAGRIWKDMEEGYVLLIITILEISS